MSSSRNDHREIGAKQELFFFHESAPGMVYWLPKGLGLKRQLMQYWEQYHEWHGYEEISAPLLNKAALWEQSGHWQYFKDDMFISQAKGQDLWALKPMNCPNAMLFFGRRPRSYRELPLRLADADLLHRNEMPGALQGLFRLRCFMQDDSHNFICRHQIEEELKHLLGVVKDFYGLFHLESGVKLYLSSRPKEFMGEVDMWQQAEKELQLALENAGINFGLKPRDGAFYGPKIDIHLNDNLEREHQCGTLQLDFNLPRRFGLQYVDCAGQLQQPLVIHRVIYGSIERFLGVLLEHLAGRLPFWYAPLQIVLIALEQGEYLNKVRALLDGIVLMQPVRWNALRYEIDARNESLERRIRDGEQKHVPLILMAGKQEAARQIVSVRFQSRVEQVALEKFKDFVQALPL